MPKIRHICLSDLHLGAPTSLLTDTPGVGGDGGTSARDLRDAFSAAFVATLAALNPGNDTADAPCVVLLGDIFDLSLGTPRSSIDAFDALLKSLANAGARDRVGRFVFVPGNHDHELWTATRFGNMVGASTAEDRFGHTTRALADPAGLPRAVQIDEVLRNNGFAGATTFYPNMGLVSPDRNRHSPDEKRLVVLHHGHFIEPIYRAMSTLTMLLDGTGGISLDAETLEQLNASWIDFVWSSDGDNGGLGADIMRNYHRMMTGGADIRLDHRLARILADKVMADLPLPRTATGRGWTEAAAKALVDSILGRYGQMERFGFQATLGADSLAGLKSYLSDTVLTQVAAECRNIVVSDLTFIFGHTHKPFETRVPVPGLAKPPAVYNTGGWVLDTPMFGTRLGAAAVFIDDDLNTASLRLCDVPQGDEQTGPDPKPTPVRVATADGSLAGNPMAEELQAALDTTSEHWNGFAQEADRAYRVKQAWIMELAGMTAAPVGGSRSTS